MPESFLKIKCPRCNQRLKVPRAKSDRKINCPSCAVVFRYHPHPSSELHSEPTENPPLGNTMAARNSSPAAMRTPQAYAITTKREARPLVTVLSDENADASLDLNGSKIEQLAPADILNVNATSSPHTKPKPTEVVEATLVTASAPLPIPNQETAYKNRTGPTRDRSAIDPTGPPATAKKSYVSAGPLSPPKPTKLEHLGPRVLNCQKKIRKREISSHRKAEWTSIACLLLSSVLIALLLGLLAFQLLGIDPTDPTASATQIITICGIYIFLFLSLYGIFRLTVTRCVRRREQMLFQVLQKGVSIQQDGHDFVVSFQRLSSIYLEEQSPLSTLLANFLPVANRFPNTQLVLAYKGGKKKTFKGCETIFTSDSLNAAIREVQRRIDLEQPTH